MNRKPRLVVLPPQHLGHEIHVGRSIVVDMVSKGILDQTNGDHVMTGLPDRRFFYDSLLGNENVVDFSLVPGISQPIKPPKNITDYLSLPSTVFNSIYQFSNFQVVNLSAYALPRTYCTFDTSEEMTSVGYSVPERYWSAPYIDLIQQFHLLSPEEIDKVIPRELSLFIIIHHRYNASVDKLKSIIHSLPTQLVKVIFTSNSNELQQQLAQESNMVFTEDLKTYSSLLHDSRCKLLISEWSGAGQIAQYTLGPQGGIWYYYDHYPDIYNFTMTHKIWELNAKLGNYFNCWDFKNASGCSTQHFGSFEMLIKSIQQIQIN
jgi:hypothetical protein